MEYMKSSSSYSKQQETPPQLFTNWMTSSTVTTPLNVRKINPSYTNFIKHFWGQLPQKHKDSIIALQDEGIELFSYCDKHIKGLVTGYASSNPLLTSTSGKVLPQISSTTPHPPKLTKHIPAKDLSPAEQKTLFGLWFITYSVSILTEQALQGKSRAYVENEFAERLLSTNQWTKLGRKKQQEFLINYDRDVVEDVEGKKRQNDIAANESQNRLWHKVYSDLGYVPLPLINWFETSESQKLKLLKQGSLTAKDVWLSIAPDLKEDILYCLIYPQRQASAVTHLETTVLTKIAENLKKSGKSLSPVQVRKHSLDYGGHSSDNESNGNQRSSSRLSFSSHERTNSNGSVSSFGLLQKSDDHIQL